MKILHLYNLKIFLLKQNEEIHHENLISQYEIFLWEFQTRLKVESDTRVFNQTFLMERNWDLQRKKP